MDYAQSLSYLDALVQLGVKAGLDHTRALAQALGRPHDSYPCVLVGGTNGKGSTCAFLESILGAAGLRVGFFSSPHLVDVRERIRVQGALITEAECALGLTEVRAAEESARAAGGLEGPPTYFEALTLLAFLHFRRAKVQVAVLEVGLGGRLDCTNVVQPVLSVVTNVGLDHQEYLGDTVESIAFEKAGIFRRGVPALTAASRPEVLAVLERQARAVGAPFHPPSGWAAVEGASGWTLSGEGRNLRLSRPPLPGDHQLANAALAVRAALKLEELGFPVGEEAIRHGVGAARWPGRLERVGAAPDTYLDGAHNLDGCAALAAWVRSAASPRKALVFACMRDKAVEAMAETLAPCFGRVWATSVPMARCASPEELRERWGDPSVHCEPDPLRALEEARRWAGPDGLVVAAGSLYLVGRFKAELQGGTPASWGTGL